MALGSTPPRVRIRWVRVGMLVHPLRGRSKRAVAQVWRGARWPRHKLDGRSIARLALVQDSVSERRRERELQVQREQLIHLARVGLLGELSAALVHELNQPLAAILANAQAGRRRRGGPATTQAALAEIFDDIVEASQRAISIIQRMRA